MKKFIFTLLLAFILPITTFAQSDRFLLTEQAHEKYFLDTMTYFVQRNNDGKITKVNCEIFILYDNEGAAEFINKNPALLEALKIQQAEKPLQFDTLYIGYEFDLNSPEKKDFSIKDVEFINANQVVASSKNSDIIIDKDKLQSFDTLALLDRTLFYIDAQFTPPTDSSLLFLEENAYSAKYLDTGSFKFAQLAAGQTNTVIVDITIVEYYTKRGIADIVDQNTVNGSYQPHHEKLLYHKYNYLINPIDNNFLQGNQAYYYANNQVETKPAQTNWQKIDEQSIYNSISAQEALDYAANYEKTLQEILQKKSEQTNNK